MRIVERVILAGLLVAGGAIGMPVALAGGGGHCAESPIERGDTVEMIGACFEPAALHVEPGTVVRFANRDPYPHNVFGSGGTWGHAEELGRGDSFEARFDRPGVFPYACSIHPGMNGVVLVGEEAAAGPEPVARAEPSGTRPPLLAWAGVALLGLGVGLTVTGLRRKPAR